MPTRVLFTLSAFCFMACGPSARQVYRGEVYFEVCFNNDSNQSGDQASRRQCWHDWLAHYTAGQSVERIDHARERVFSSNEASAALVEMASATDVEETNVPVELTQVGQTSASGSGAPQDTSAPVVVHPDQATDRERLSAMEAREQRRRDRRFPAPSSPTITCPATCEQSWTSCIESCRDSVNETPTYDLSSCRSACRVTHQVCGRGCY